MRKLDRLDTDALTPASSSSGVEITRDDLATVVGVYKRESEKLNKLGALGMVGAAAIGLILAGMSQVFGMVDDWIPIFMILAYVLAAAALIAEWVARRRVVDRIQINCLHCDSPLLGSGSPKSVLSRAKVTVATGSCSVCGRDLCR